MSDKIRYTVEERIARITFNEPDKRNALNYDMVQSLIARLKEAEADEAVRVVLIEAAGDNYSAGGNLKEFKEEVTAPAIDHWQSGALWEELFLLVPQMSKPVITAVQGYALAGGCGLVALCDMAIAAEDAKFGMTEIRIGLFPLLVLPALRRAVGDKKAIELALTGAIFEAAEAHRIGLVNQVVPRDALSETATTLARELAAKSPEAMLLGKRLLWDTLDMTYAQAMSHARSVRVNYMLSADLSEGISAFLEKRTPEW